MTVTLPAEKLSDLQEARRHAENLSYYRQKHQEVPRIDAEEMLELYTAIEQLEDSGVKTKTAPVETTLITTWHDRGRIVAEPSRGIETKPSAAQTPAEPTETKPLATDLDSVAERILAAFKSEDDT